MVSNVPSITLNWNENQDENVIRYEVDRRTIGETPSMNRFFNFWNKNRAGGWRRVANVPKPPYTDNGVMLARENIRPTYSQNARIVPGYTYEYRIRAVDNLGNKGVWVHCQVIAGSGHSQEATRTSRDETNSTNSIGEEDRTSIQNELSDLVQTNREEDKYCKYFLKENLEKFREELSNTHKLGKTFSEKKITGNFKKSLEEGMEKQKSLQKGLDDHISHLKKLMKKLKEKYRMEFSSDSSEAFSELEKIIETQDELKIDIIDSIEEFKKLIKLIDDKDSYDHLLEETQNLINLLAGSEKAVEKFAIQLELFYNAISASMEGQEKKVSLFLQAEIPIIQVLYGMVKGTKNSEIIKQLADYFKILKGAQNLKFEDLNSSVKESIINKCLYFRNFIGENPVLRKSIEERNIVLKEYTKEELFNLFRY